MLRPGDLVIARDEADDGTGPVAPRVIKEDFVRTGEILEVHVAGEIIETTPEHPFYVQDKGWTAAGELEPEDLLSTLEGDWLSVEKIVETGRVETVYNLRVADYHTYFVSTLGNMGTQYLY